MMIHTIFFILNDLTSAESFPGWWRYYGWFENHQQSKWKACQQKSHPSSLTHRTYHSRGQDRWWKTVLWQEMVRQGVWNWQFWNVFLFQNLHELHLLIKKKKTDIFPYWHLMILHLSVIKDLQVTVALKKNLLNTQHFKVVFDQFCTSQVSSKSTSICRV